MIRTGPQHWTVGQREGSLTRVQTERLRDLHNKERELAKSLGGLTQEEAATDPELSKVIKELNQIEEDRQAVYRGEWSPTGGTPKAAETKTKKATDADKAEAKQLVRQFPEKEARIKARFREAFGEDL
jgi:hypothetical protein